jgi:hypothetical protein
MGMHDWSRHRHQLFCLESPPFPIADDGSGFASLLLGDQKACRYWSAIPTADTTWTVVDKQNEAACN